MSDDPPKIIPRELLVLDNSDFMENTETGELVQFIEWLPDDPMYACKVLDCKHKDQYCIHDLSNWRRKPKLEDSPVESS